MFTSNQGMASNSGFFLKPRFKTWVSNLKLWLKTLVENPGLVSVNHVATHTLKRWHKFILWLKGWHWTENVCDWNLGMNSFCWDFVCNYSLKDCIQSPSIVGHFYRYLIFSTSVTDRRTDGRRDQKQMAIFTIFSLFLTSIRCDSLSHLSQPGSGLFLGLGQKDR